MLGINLITANERTLKEMPLKGNCIKSKKRPCTTNSSKYLLLVKKREGATQCRATSRLTDDSNQLFCIKSL